MNMGETISIIKFYIIDGNYSYRIGARQRGKTIVAHFGAVASPFRELRMASTHMQWGKYLIL